MNLARPLFVLLLCALLGACASKQVRSTSPAPLQTPSRAVPEHLLLDVGVVVFDPGIEDFDEEEDEFVYPEVRRAESMYMPGLLVEALQNSGAWGAVRIIPGQDQLTDLTITGQILHSDGEELELAIKARDSRGNVWLEKTYPGNASRYAYEVTARNAYDPFQTVYNDIANDLLQLQEEITDSDRENIRLTTEMLFARSFSPDSFDGYLAKNRRGNWLIMRLPAEDDPMLQRVRKVRDYDRAYIDELQEHYALFEQQMGGPYQEWRKLSYEEAVALEEVRRQSRNQMIAGAVAVLAGIAAASSNESGSDGNATRAAGQIAVLGGGLLFKRGLEKRAEVQIHVQELEELGMSLEAEITPQVIELEDRTVMLSGNVEEQYAQWRELLAEIYRAEIGALALPADGPGAADTL